MANASKDQLANLSEIKLGPGESFASVAAPGISPKVLVIACGALAREVLAVFKLNAFNEMRLHCLPAILHNHPEKIPARLRETIKRERKADENVVVVYSDCGAKGEIERVCEEEGAHYLGGAHCFQMFCGEQDYDQLMEEELGTFFLTDFLAKHFDVFVMQSLGLDKHPQLVSAYFGHYRRVVYLAQIESEALQDAAKAAAEKLGLAYEYRYTGYGAYDEYLTKINEVLVRAGAGRRQD